MRLYIDKENLHSFINCSKDPLYADCTKTMQRQLDITFNFSKEELKTDEFLLKWFTVLTEGVNDTLKEFNEIKFPERPLKSNAFNSFTPNQLSSIYLINDDKLDILKSKGAIQIGDIGEEIDNFKQLFLYQNDYKFDKKIKIGSPDFSQWENLKIYSCSISDIIIVDSFILSDSSLIESNLIKYLKILCAKVKCKINIVIYTKTKDANVNYTTLSPMIRNAIESITGIKPNLTLIKYYDQKNVESAAEHDRTIFTNYFRVYSGDTFNFFNSSGNKITKGREIQYSGYADKENHKLAMDLVNDIQNNIDFLPSDSIEGDKKSNFLNFQ